jgi:hypothetical protein
VGVVAVVVVDCVAVAVAAGIGVEADCDCGDVASAASKSMLGKFIYIFKRKGWRRKRKRQT